MVRDTIPRDAADADRRARRSRHHGQPLPDATTSLARRPKRDAHMSDYEPSRYDHSSSYKSQDARAAAAAAASMPSRRPRREPSSSAGRRRQPRQPSSDDESNDDAMALARKPPSSTTSATTSTPSSESPSPAPSPPPVPAAPLPPMRPTEISEATSSGSSSESTDDDEVKDEEQSEVDEEEDDDDEDDEEVAKPIRRAIEGPKDLIEEVDDEANHHLSSDDDESLDAMRQQLERKRRRRQHRRHISDPLDKYSRHAQPRRSESDLDSPVPMIPLTPDIDRSPRKERNRRVASVIEASRPPVSSSKRTSRRGSRTADIVPREPDSQRNRAAPSSRASARSASRPRSILGGIFGGAPTPPLASPGKPPKTSQCVSCMSERSSHKIAKLKCGHRMCNSCLQRIFHLSITDPQHMPPKCCSPDLIPLKHVERLFDVAFKKTWNRKFAEFSTRNRIYCPARKCGEWIKPANIYRENGRKVAHCGRCKTKVCGTCNGKWHPSIDCPNDEETNLFLEQAKEEGWQRCYRCKSVVELKEGCNHMTCRCGAEFCMICGHKWRTCDCIWFNHSAEDLDQVDHLHGYARARGDFHDIYASDGSPISPGMMGRMVPPAAPRPPPSAYEEEMYMRHMQDRRDADIARRMQLYDDDEEDAIPGVMDVLGIGNAAGHHMNDDYRRMSHPMAGPPPPMPPMPPMYDRGPGYSPADRRSRGIRGDMQQRLADRFSENRHSLGSRPVGSPMVSPHTIPHPMGSPIGMPPPPLPMSMTMPMMSPGPPPPIPIVRAHTMEPDMYGSPHSTPRSERMYGPRLSRTYEEDEIPHAPQPPRSRRPSALREEYEGEPPSSSMAGLTGVGRGMNRVDEWRGFVQPGLPTEEGTARRASGR